jgi:hypothetical protein
MAHDKHHSEFVAGIKHEPVPLDPENDINARSATLWVLIGTAVLFVLLWLLVILFSQINETERHAKIYAAPNEELLDVVGEEQAFLNGQNPTKKSIEQVINALAKKAGK